jgi:hypothetical protein
MNGPSPEPFGPFQWHKDAHGKWGKERLYFWRLQFLPVYLRQQVVEALLTVFAEHRVASYFLYELFGGSDLMLRLWLRTATMPEGFEDSLRSLPSLHRADIFEVRRILRHWVWEENGEHVGPSEERLLQQPQDREIELVNQGADLDLMSQYEQDRLIARAPRQRGIKFFMVVTPAAEEPAHGVGVQLRNQLESILDDADRVGEKSLYEGLGFGRFLIMGRVDFTDYSAIREQIADPINLQISPAAYGARTYTMLVPGDDFLRFQDALPTATQVLREVEELSAEQALHAGESGTVEVKAAAFVDVGKWLQTGEEPEESRSLTREGLLRAVCALLNTEGGTVVLGALERGKLTEVQASRAHRSPVVGDFVCIGLEIDMRRGSWDAYERRINQTMSSQIDRDPLLWTTLARDEIAGVTMARVVARTPDRYFYYVKGDPALYVRRGAMTVALFGSEADEYRRAHPRG